MSLKPAQKFIVRMRKKKLDDFVIKVRLQEEGWKDAQIDKAFKKVNAGKAIVKNFIVLVILTMVIIAGAYSYIRIIYFDGVFFQESSDISKFKTGPKQVELSYFIDGQDNKLLFTVYEGLYKYFTEKNRDIFYIKNPPTAKEEILKFTDNPKQLAAIKPIAKHIKSITQDTDKQAKIAISLVQHIPYDTEVKKTDPVEYPYEVLYRNKGVCSGKAKLLIDILRELGFATAAIRFNEEKHEAMGIACPQEYSYMNSGYCFVETTNIAIITDSDTKYKNIGVLTSTPDIIPISEGIALKDVSKEVKDLKEIQELTKNLPMTTQQYNRVREISMQYGYDMQTAEEVLLS